MVLFKYTVTVHYCFACLFRFEKLRDQGLAIYGADLEEAVSRRHAINEMHSQKQHKRVAKKEEMEKEVILRQRELDRLLKFNEISE